MYLNININTEMPVKLPWDLEIFMIVGIFKHGLKVGELEAVQQ
jgi:hypothetical protein